MEFWNSLLTEKSWKIMQELKKEDFRFIVIGGWSAYLWSKTHKSKDIDVVIPDFNSLETLKQKYFLKKNDNLKKYEIQIEEIDIDIYLPHYSKLTLPFEAIIQNTSSVEGFETVIPEVLLILKQGAELDRKESVKGQKDRIDIMTLLCYAKIDFNKYRELISQNKLTNFSQRLKEIVNTFRDLKHLNMTVKEYSKVKKELLSEI